MIRVLGEPKLGTKFCWKVLELGQIGELTYPVEFLSILSEYELPVLGKLCLASNYE